MVDKDLHEMPLGSEGELQLEIKEGDLMLSVSHASKGVAASLSARMSSEYFMDKLKEAIPGEIDDAIIDLIKAALKG